MAGTRWWRKFYAPRMSSQNEELLLFGSNHRTHSLQLQSTKIEATLVFSTIWTWVYKYSHLLHRGKQFKAFLRQFSTHIQKNEKKRNTETTILTKKSRYSNCYFVINAGVVVVVVVIVHAFLSSPTLSLPSLLSLAVKIAMTISQLIISRRKKNS